ncbi:MAG: hypothetical protein ACYCOO_01890 [Chitinophagaceae bacterium]
MLKIIEKSSEKLVVEKVPIYFYVLCGSLFSTGIILLFLLSNSQGLLGFILGTGTAIIALFLLLNFGNTTLVGVNKKNRMVYCWKRGIFTVKMQKYPFCEINRVSPDLGYQGFEKNISLNKFGIVLEKTTGKRKILLHVKNLILAKETSDLMNTYLS